jgi:hypothetical protein
MNSLFGINLEQTFRKIYAKWKLETLKHKNKINASRVLARNAFEEAFMSHAGTKPQKCIAAARYRGLGSHLLSTEQY